jgi:hypothetical protein
MSGLAHSSLMTILGTDLLQQALAVTDARLGRVSLPIGSPAAGPGALIVEAEPERAAECQIRGPTAIKIGRGIGQNKRPPTPGQSHWGQSEIDLAQGIWAARTPSELFARALAYESPRSVFPPIAGLAHSDGQWRRLDLPHVSLRASVGGLPQHEKSRRWVEISDGSHSVHG